MDRLLGVDVSCNEAPKQANKSSQDIGVLVGLQGWPCARIPSENGEDTGLENGDSLTEGESFVGVHRSAELLKGTVGMSNSGAEFRHHMTIGMERMAKVLILGD